MNVIAAYRNMQAALEWGTEWELIELLANVKASKNKVCLMDKSSS